MIDLGSVSCQLLVTDGTSRIRRAVDVVLGGASMSVTGEVSGRTIDDAALARTTEALTQHLDTIAGIDGSMPLRVLTTSPARRAVNAQALLDRVADATGVEPEVISGSDEARLAFAGAVGDGRFTAERDDPVLTVDIGGGSTEVSFGAADGPSAGLSLPVGGALLTSAYLDGDPPRPEELSAALSVVELHLDDVRREVPALGPAMPSLTAIGLGALVTLAAIEVGSDDDVHNVDGDGPLDGFVLSRPALEDVFRTIATENRADRAHNPGLPPSRVADIVGACAIAVETMRQFDLDAITISQRGLADGVAAEMLATVR
ncbi:MAG: hypothetical protein AAFN30_13295 [Actinomycetota bacterium]